MILEQGHREHAALSWVTLHGKSAVLSFHQRLCDGQPQAQAGAPVSITPVEALEDVREHLSRHPRTA